MSARRRLPSRPLALVAGLAAALAGLLGGALTALPSQAATGGCPETGALFCEDFDALAVGAGSGTGWQADTQSGSLKVETLGSGRALHVHTDGNGGAFLTVRGLSVPQAGYHGRVWIKVDAFPTAPSWAHFTMIETTGTGSSEVVRPFGGQFVPGANLTPAASAGRALYGIGADGGPTGDWTDWRNSAPARAGAWTCVQWSSLTADNQVALTLDGVANPDLTVSTTEHGGAATAFVLPKVDTVKVGWQLYQGGPTPDHYDVLVDNLALGSSAIPCGSAPA